jgi:hypothetical protein
MGTDCDQEVGPVRALPPPVLAFRHAAEDAGWRLNYHVTTGTVSILASGLASAAAPCTTCGVRGVAYAAVAVVTWPLDSTADTAPSRVKLLIEGGEQPQATFEDVLACIAAYPARTPAN